MTRRSAEAVLRIVLGVVVLATLCPPLVQSQNHCVGRTHCDSKLPKLNPTDVAKIAYRAGPAFTQCSILTTMVAIAAVESQYYPDCVCDNGSPVTSQDWGLWQANDLKKWAWPPYNSGSGRSKTLPDCALDTPPDTTCAERYAYRQSSYGTDFETAWYNSYDNGYGPGQYPLYLAALPEAQKAATAAKCCSDGPCQPLPPPGGTTLSVQTITSGDPNDKVGSQGVTAQQYISGSSPLRYAIFFTNDSNATAPAQKVVVTDGLSLTKMNLSTLSLGPINFGSQFVSPPSGPGDFFTSVNLAPTTNLFVSISTHLDASSGLLTWTLQSIDPATGKPPTDPTVGFLPPGATGGVFFDVMPKYGLPTNIQVQNQAVVVFDVNPPISTPTWANTLDNTPPTSSVLALPSNEGTPNFTVQWSGTDVGSGVQNYTIYVTDNGGPFTVWQWNTTATSATFAGQSRHTYGFYSVARDLVGNVEAAKANAEATTVVGGDTTPPVTTASLGGLAGSNGWYRGPVTVTLTATDPDSQVAATHYSLDGGPLATYTVPFAISTDGVHQLSFYSIDPSGNQEKPTALSIKIDSTAPAITAAPNPATLWPPNGKMVPVTISGAITDGTSGVNQGSATFAVVDEYGSVQPSGSVRVQTNGIYSFTLSLQASRLGNDSDGRLYTVVVKAQDNAGNQGTSSTTVVVPHDQGSH